MSKPRKYHELAGWVEMASQTRPIYLEQGDVGLTEDLILGYERASSRDGGGHVISVEGVRNLIRELDAIPPDEVARLVLVRTADRLFTTADGTEAVLSRLERERLNHKLRIVLVGDDPGDKVRDWFLNRGVYGIVNEPSIDKLGAWMAARTAGRWGYHKPTDMKGALITEETGLALMEWVGWDYASAVQAARTIRVWGQNLDFNAVQQLVPPKLGFGYADSLVFGSGRRGALALASAISVGEVPRVLGLVRYYLRQYAKLRALEVERMTDRAVTEASGMHSYWWRTKYQPTYPRYTNDRIRIRAGLVESVQAVGSIGALEYLATSW